MIATALYVVLRPGTGEPAAVRGHASSPVSSVLAGVTSLGGDGQGGQADEVRWRVILHVSAWPVSEADQLLEQDLVTAEPTGRVFRVLSASRRPRPLSLQHVVCDCVQVTDDRADATTAVVDEATGLVLTRVRQMPAPPLPAYVPPAELFPGPDVYPSPSLFPAA